MKKFSKGAKSLVVVFGLSAFFFIYYSRAGIELLSEGWFAGSAAVDNAYTTIIGNGVGSGDASGSTLFDQSAPSSSSTDGALSENNGQDFYGSAGGNGDDAAASDSDALNVLDVSNVDDIAPSMPASQGSILSTGVAASAKKTSEKIAAKPTPPAVCSFDGVASPSHEVIFNEIAWMGSPAATASVDLSASSAPLSTSSTSASANREWIELKNDSAADVDVSGWQILDASGKLHGVLGDGAVIPAGGLFLLARSPASGFGAVDAMYSGALPNTGDQLALFDASCVVSDYLDASGGWPGGDNTTKQTFERDADGAGWHTSALPGGTPLAENSAGLPPVASSSASAAPSVSSASGTQAAQIAPTTPSSTSVHYQVSVSMTGGGSGTVSSSPSGIFCGFTCLAKFVAGTSLTVAELPDAGSVFDGWSGACTGTAATCSFIVSSSLAVVAHFRNPAADMPAGQAPPLPETDASGTSSGLAHIVIDKIQIAGASSSNDFVALYNPTGSAIDLNGWKLHKKSSTGTDYSLKVFVAGNTISPGGYFTWANSIGDFAQSIDADASSTETLSADNSVALIDASGIIVDAVAWGMGANQYGEGAMFPTNPAAGQVLTRKTENGNFIDTDDNASDFTLQ